MYFFRLIMGYKNLKILFEVYNEIYFLQITQHLRVIMCNSLQFSSPSMWMKKLTENKQKIQVITFVLA